MSKVSREYRKRKGTHSHFCIHQAKSNCRGMLKSIWNNPCDAKGSVWCSRFYNHCWKIGSIHRVCLVGSSRDALSNRIRSHHNWYCDNKADSKDKGVIWYAKPERFPVEEVAVWLNSTGGLSNRQAYQSKLVVESIGSDWGILTERDNNGEKWWDDNKVVVIKDNIKAV